MSFENFSLRRSDKPIDWSVVENWLEQAPFARRTAENTWAIYASHKRAVLMTRLQEEDPTKPSHEMEIGWLNQELYCIAGWDTDALGRTGELVRLLTEEGVWQMKVDWGDWQPFSTIEKYFPQMDPIADDPTEEPVVEGTLWRWERAGSQVFVHSSGAFRVEGKSLIKGELAPERLQQWNEAVCHCDPDDPGLLSEPEAEGGVVLEVIKLEGTKRFLYNVETPPKTFRQIQQLIDVWWDDGEAAIRTMLSGTDADARGFLPSATSSALTAR